MALPPMMPHVPGLNLSDLIQNTANIAKQLASLVNDLMNGNYLLYQRAPVSTSFSASQVTVDTNATLLAAANTSRQRLVIRNPGSGISIYLGGSSVTASTGFLVPTGGDFEMKASEGLSTAAIYGIAAASSAAISVLEW